MFTTNLVTEAGGIESVTLEDLFHVRKILKTLLSIFPDTTLGREVGKALGRLSEKLNILL